MMAVATRTRSRAEDTAERAGLLAGVTAMELGVLGVTLLLPVVFVPAVFSPFWVPKMALLLCVVGPGLVTLLADVRARDHAAIAALVFLLVASAATWFGQDPVASLVGLHEVDGGLLFVGASLGMWAMGRHLGDKAAGRLVDALIIGIGITAAVAWIQVIFDLPIDALGLWQHSRAGALQGNPIYLGALAGAALAPVAWRAARAKSVAPWLAAIALLAGAAQLSGSRIGLAPGLVAVAWFAWHAGRKRGSLIVVATVVGVVLAFAIAPSGGSATSRSDTSDVSTNSAARLGIWKMGLHAFEDHPLLGVGPAGFRAATSRYMPLDIAQDHGPDVLLVDAHNGEVEYLTTTGVLGLLAASVWLVLAARRARGPLAWFAVLVGISWLVQPQGVDTTPLLMVALGASAPLLVPFFGGVRKKRRWVAATVATLIIGVLAASTFLYSEHELAIARDDGSIAALDRARTFLGFYPVVNSLATEIAIRDGLAGDRAARKRALALARATAHQEPTRPAWWNRLGEVEGQWGSLGASAHAFHEALRYDPWSVQAMQGLAKLARLDHDRSALAHWDARLCRFSEATCPTR